MKGRKILLQKKNLINKDNVLRNTAFHIVKQCVKFMINSSF